MAGAVRKEMPMVTFEEAKAYLRVDTGDEDALISSLLASAESVCCNVARLTAEEWTAVSGFGEEEEAPAEGEPDTSEGGDDAEGSEDTESTDPGNEAAENMEDSEVTDEAETLMIRQEEKSRGEVLQMKEVLRVGVLYALGYLYEHREEADHHGLVITLRNLLFAVREGVY